MRKLWQITNGVLGVALAVAFTYLVAFIGVKLLMLVFK